MARNIQMREPGNAYADVLHPETNSAMVLSPDGATTVFAQLATLAPLAHVGATGAAHGLATTSVAGFMSSADKTKLDGVEAGANAYAHPTTAGNKHVPSGGSSGQILGWSSDGTAVWQAAPSAGVWGSITGTLSAQSDLSTALSGKSDTSHTHDIGGPSVTGMLSTTKLIEPSYIYGATPTEWPLFDVLRGDRSAFLPADQIIIETSTDAGTTWVDAGYSDSDKRKLFTGQRPYITIPLKAGVRNCDCMTRITITAMKYNVPGGTAETAKYGYWNSTYVTSTERYCTLERGWTWINAVADRIYVRVDRSSGSDSNNWVNESESYQSGWSGGTTFTLSGATFGGGTSQTSNDWNRRITLRTCASDNTFNNANLSSSYNTTAQGIYHMKLLGPNVWVNPNNYMYNDHLYSWDENQNAFFPATVRGTTLTSTISTGTAPLTVTSTTVVSNLNADLLDGLHSTDFAASSHVGATGAAHGLATGSVNGFLSSSDFTKLAGIATGANNYSHPNHTGDVTSTGDGATAIGANKVTLAHMAQIATDSFLGRDTASTGNVEVLSVATVKTMLGLVLTDTANATGFSIAGGTTSKTLTVSNTLTLAGTDSSTLNIGSGGTLGTAAFTASTAYATAAQGTTADNAIPKSTFTATNDFIVGTGSGTYAKKTLAETQTILGLGSAAYTASAAYATAAQGSLAGTALQPSLVTAANDFLVGTSNGVVAKKTLAETKTILGLPLTDTALATGFSIAGGTTSKTLTVSNTLTLAGTDSSTLNIGAGGTLASGAFAAAYSHPTGDGNLHVPATSTTNDGKALIAGATAGSMAWTTLTATMVGLGNVTNESKATMFTGAALTGTPTAPTAAVTTSTTQIATTAFVNAEIANDAAPIGHVGATGAAHGNATGSVAGFMTASDYTKLSGIATGAEVNQNTFSNIAVSGQTTVAADAKTDTLTLVAGTNITITTDAAADSITINATGSGSDLGPYGISYNSTSGKLEFTYTA